MTKKKIIWLAVQPTPYNAFFYEQISRSEKLDLELYYSEKSLKILPWKSSFENSGGLFFNRKMGIDWRIVRKALSLGDDLFVVVGWDDLTKLVVLLIRRLQGKPFAIWTDSVSLKVNWIYRLKQIFLSFILNRATYILTTGEYGIERFISSRLAFKNNNYVNLPFFVPLPNIDPKITPQGDVRFLCVGRLVKRKGYDHVIRAFNECRSLGYDNFELNIAGTGPEEEHLKALTKDLGISNRINFLGWKEPEELVSLRLHNDVFIQYVPTPDPFPVAVLEAMAFYMPVIGSNVAGSVVERVENGVNGFIVEASDPSELVTAIANILENSSLIPLMSENAGKKAREWNVERGVEIVEGLCVEGKNKA